MTLQDIIALLGTSPNIVTVLILLFYFLLSQGFDYYKKRRLTTAQVNDVDSDSLKTQIESIQLLIPPLNEKIKAQQSTIETLTYDLAEVKAMLSGELHVVQHQYIVLGDRPFVRDTQSSIEWSKVERRPGME